MGITAARRSKPRSPSSARLVHGILRRRGLGRAVPHTLFPAQQLQTGCLAGRWGIAEPTTFWGRLHDDRALIGLKIVLLAFLFLLTALLEGTA